MKRMPIQNLYTFTKFATLFFLLALYSCGSTQALLPDDEPILSWMEQEHVPATGVCIIEDAKITQIRMYGSIEHHAQAPLNTFFNIASLTKPLVSMSVLHLVSNGQWELDEPLFHYWIDPDVSDDSLVQKLTTRHVLTHQSGLPNWRGHEPGGNLSFAFEPGTQWKYSGEGFEYLRKALENKFHVPIEKLVDSILFTPLQMMDTRFFWDDNIDTTLYADRYDANGVRFEPDRWYDANASNLVLTTVENYGKFGVAVLKQELVSPEVQREMIRSHVMLKNGTEMGLGWFLVNNLPGEEYALFHSGSNRGQNTKIILLPKSKRGIVVFTNGENGSKVCEEIISTYFETGKEILERLN